MKTTARITLSFTIPGLSESPDTAIRTHKFAEGLASAAVSLATLLGFDKTTATFRVDFAQEATPVAPPKGGAS